MIKPQTLKGFRDFLPVEARKRQYVIDTLKSVFESYGFEPLETPALEYEEILTGKYGDEGDKLMYRFTDRGDRKVALRYDQTVPLARVVAQYGDKLPMPFKRYQIQNVWRADNTQKGRYREFLQCDTDIVGTDSPLADAEIIALAIKSLENLGFVNFKILVNDRENLNFANKSIKLSQDQNIKAMIAVDKLKKIGKEAVIKELEKSGFSNEESLLILKTVKESMPTKKLNEIFIKLEDLSISSSKYEFSPTLARGLNYYTGLIIEIEVPQYSAGSLGGGGRYDNLIGLFANKQIPAVGFAFGFDRLMEAMDELKLFPTDILSSSTKVLVTVFNNDLLEKSIEICSRLRSNNISVELYLDENASLEKQLKYADKKGIPYAIIIGPDEASKNMVTIRNMKTREQKTISLDEVLSVFPSP
ncbi:MAG: histidine--tRNA ligase [Candidatus Levybacteria bacterium RIFCSPHIGHO2_01_FULL_38_26]|nr:MAG: histidine--tRNA ligase [Candidatus Levybacteria bacterium RIFCSPHIGHO2_01_FULL_38_26]